MHALTQLLEDNGDESNTRYNILTNEEANWIAQAIKDNLNAKHTS